MLTALSIRNVVLIDSLDINFERGLSALTGETGAGKSIILDALGMATGARSDKGLVRAGADKALSVASFELPAVHVIRTQLDEGGIEIEASEPIMLRRVVSADGGSRAFINDQPVTVKLLSAIGRQLLEVHGQHDGRGLLDSATHITLLDRFGAYSSKLQGCAKSFEALKAARARLEQLVNASQKASDDRDFYEHSIAELDRLDPKPDEEEALAARRRFLQSAEGAVSELSAAQDAMGEGGEFEARLGAALRGLERVQSKLGGPLDDMGDDANDDSNDSAAHTKLAKAIKAIEQAVIETEEARGAIADCAYAFNVEPGALDKTEERLFALRAAARKFNTPIALLAETRAKFAQHLYDIDNSDAALTQARAHADKAHAAYDKAASTLTQARIKAAKVLDKAVMAELPPLKMDKARFETAISAGRDSAQGRDAVIFTVSTNPGTPMGALDKIASGGEMSRFALAIKVALTGDMSASGDMTLIFDEVDQGVGGAVADAVGKRLSKLASGAQVLVVTHSPQVAASADAQFLIRKDSRGDSTLTQVTELKAYAREEEIARMLSGEVITEEARAAARQLMGAA